MYDCEDEAVAKKVQENMERFFQSLAFEGLDWRDEEAAVSLSPHKVTNRKILACIRGAKLIGATVPLMMLANEESQRMFIFSTIVGTCEPLFLATKTLKCVECGTTFGKGEESSGKQCCFCLRWRHSKCTRDEDMNSDVSSYVCKHK